MATRTEKDRAKAQQEKFQAILSNLLKDEDNKYCEDCDAKGPRWASWNLGIFLCIRCAGIHRNLGVHISRVKSVNLDSWTAEQVAMMQEMGNSRARAVYEANVQDSFRRPQTDSALEAFIRAKYEQKKYIAKEWVPPKPVVPKEYVIEWLEDDKTEKKKIRNKPTSNISLSSVPPSSQSSSSNLASADARANAKPATTAATAAAEPKPTQPPAPKPKSSSDDLLGLDFSFNDTSKAEVPQTGGSGGSQGGDLLADIFGGSQASAPTPGGGGQQNLMATQQNGSAEPNLFESGSGEGQGEKKSAKDSIMALYGSGGGQQQMFGVPGTDMTPNGDMMPHNSGIATSHFVSMASNNPALSASQITSGMMTSNLGMANAFSGVDSRMTPSGAGLMTSNTGMLGPNPGIYSPTMSTSGSNVPANSPFKSQASNMVSGSTGMGRSSSLDVPGKPATLPILPGTSQLPKLAQSGGSGQTLGTAQNAGLMAPRGGTSSSGRSLGTAQNTGFMTSRAGMSSNTKSVSSHMAVMPTTKPQVSGVVSPGMVNNPFLYTGAEIYQQYLPNMYYYPASGGMYMPQQQMYGTGGGMQPMGQPQAGMMGMQQGMMGQPVQQGMMGMQQQPGMMFGNASQMGQNQMGQNQMGQNLMGGNMMGAGAQGGMMGRPAGQMYMQQQPQQQQMNPMQQQMQFQQMQQQMANMSMGGGSQMGGMQAPQQAAVGGGSWGGVGTGQTLSTNLWQ